MKQTKHLHIRIDPAALAALDQLRERLSRRGVAASRSTAVRLAIIHAQELLKDSKIHV